MGEKELSQDHSTVSFDFIAIEIEILEPSALFERIS